MICYCDQCANYHEPVTACGHSVRTPAPLSPTVEQTAPATTPMASSAWLIERPGVPGPMWASIQTDPFVRFLWTFDASKAIRYARREDAEATKALMQDSRNLIATEHIWYDAIAMNSEAPQKLQEAGQSQRERRAIKLEDGGAMGSHDVVERELMLTPDGLFSYRQRIEERGREHSAAIAALCDSQTDLHKKIDAVMRMLAKPNVAVAKKKAAPLVGKKGTGRKG